jgi:hypothetical protein
MRRYSKIIASLCICFPVFLFAWGNRAHQIIASIAKSQLDQNVIETVDFYLKGMSWEDAATWMDVAAKEPKNSQMNSWHYAYVEKDKTYVKVTTPNLVNQLELTINLLKNRKLLDADLVYDKLKVLFHLIGDIHQPMRCGYPADQGGNKVQVTVAEKNCSLHSAWDTEIIEAKKVDMWECLKSIMAIPDKEKTEIKKIDVQAWMSETRTLLPAAYGYKNAKLDDTYLNEQTAIIKKQLTKAGLRLAAVLKANFS